MLDEEFLNLTTVANDARVPTALAAARDADGAARTTARQARCLVSAYVWDRSAYHHAVSLLGPTRVLLDRLLRRQHADGTFDSGNLHSPPDSAFTAEDVCLMWSLLAADGSPETGPHRAILERVAGAVGPALATGGVHTPNHRWAVSAALARIHQLWPDPRYADRIDEWLAEGIDATVDGIYSERSPTYAAEVTNPSLLTIARLRNRPDLLDVVRRNLVATLYHLEPNGEVETVASRRQDQTRIRDVWWYLTQFRELSLVDGDGRFATVAKDIERRQYGELGTFLAEVLERPELATVLPGRMPVPDDYVEVYESQQVARIRRGDRTATVFGGTDYHQIREIGSGLSTNPTFFRMRQGTAILDSVRLAPRFFGTGHFRAAGLRRLSERVFELSDEVDVPYYLPLAARHRRSDGDYAHTQDGRFHAKMDFPNRPRTLRTLRTVVTVGEVGSGFGSGFDLTFDVDGSDVPLAIELCFRPGGTLNGVEPLDTDGDYQLVEGTGGYTVGRDRIEFGPGNGAARVAIDPGERYTHLSGSLVPDGVRVYVTGRSPLRYVLRLRVFS